MCTISCVITTISNDSRHYRHPSQPWYVISRRQERQKFCEICHLWNYKTKIEFLGFFGSAQFGALPDWYSNAAQMCVTESDMRWEQTNFPLSAEEYRTKFFKLWANRRKRRDFFFNLTSIHTDMSTFSY